MDDESSSYEGYPEVAQLLPQDSDPSTQEQAGYLEYVAEREPSEVRKLDKIELMSAAELCAMPAPEREWAWRDWLPLGTASLLGGPPGAGKSLLAQTIAMAVSKGLPLFGSETQKMSTMYLTCEDDDGELQRRTQSIAASFGLTHHTFDNCFLRSKVGDANPAICDGSFRMTPNYYELDWWMEKHQLQLVFLDVIPDFWNGNEIVRQEVNKFVKGVLVPLAVKHNACIVGLYHPSVFGQTRGKGTSGSTAWEASARSRNYLTEADKNGIRKLSGMKNNYAGLQDIYLRWVNGALELTEQSYTDPDLKDGGRQKLGKWATKLLELLDVNGGEATTDEINKAIGSGNKRDAIDALTARRLIKVDDGIVILLEP
ncbi:MAG: AAA family ATPase [Pseudomonadales bacterium]|nr:AAA family ATPase [Pseudomonadales bacterium]